MLKEIDLRQLTKVLKKLGFERKEVPGSHQVFINRDANAIIPLPLGRRVIGQPHIGIVKRLLEEKGIIGRDEFEELYRQT